MLAEWLKNIVVCSILFSVVLYIAPDPKMRRYVQSAVGFVMMMVVINPVIGWLGYADRIEFNTYSESLGMDVAEGDDEMYVRAMEEVVERFISDNCNADAVVRIVTGEELGIDSMEIYIQSDKVDTDDPQCQRNMVLMRTGLPSGGAIQIICRRDCSGGF